MYELFEHTADLGVHVTAGSLDALMADAAAGLFAVITGDPSRITPTAVERFVVAGHDPTWLLWDWLREAHAAFELRRMLLRDFDVAVGPAGLSATARGERFDPARHRLAHEVKAITQHALAVRQTAAGWDAVYIVDI